MFRDSAGIIVITCSPANNVTCMLTSLCFIVGQFVVAKGESRVSASPTIRHFNCAVLCGPTVERCDECSRYRKTLRALCSKENHQDTPRSHPSSRVNYRFLSNDELKERLHEVHTLQRNTAKKLQWLQVKIAASVEKEVVDLDETSYADIKGIMEQCSEAVTSKHSPDSFQRVFWEQQLHAATLSCSRRRRWHPLMIKWTLYLRHISGKAYETLWASGCLALPSQRTLRDYTYFVRSSFGFSDDVDKQLMDVAGLSELHEFQKCITLVMDEMHIKEELVFHKNSSCLVGFANLGNINDLLLKYEHSIESGPDSPTPLAKSMLVFFVRGLLMSLQFPYAQFPTKSLSGDLIFQPF